MDKLLNINGLEGYFFDITRIFFIACSFLYLVFALIVVKQVTSMSKSVTDKFNVILILFSFIHLGFSILLILTMFGL
ncbi:MAG: hypothetical protein PHE71_03020 [Candidatus Shapirobacteria bacterium]|nr:hypothetical protein [Candidatus Shapirobacteria bacterium]